ncbi:MAG: TVP38/TMEM64 family protein [Synechococcales cyanobacterium RU_4_20]|nr:TVP38/TMEM64 family protein [Synechococcales cyanobacterium RU_4_20]NJR70096.1 TVP38/TMEM64 family protein [Synechococcales cyanobacterium CRU_2_2]
MAPGKILKYLAIAAAVMTLIFLAKQFDIQTVFQNALAWVDGLGAWGPIAFMVIYNLATVLFLPGSLLTLGGGVLFGVVKGSAYVFVAALIGATLAFLIGRYVARGWVASKILGNQNFRVIDEAIAKEGLKIVFLTRLSPIFPFNLLNYALGLTQVSLKDYVLGSLGMLPGTIMYVYIGSLAGNLAQLGSSTVDPATAKIQWMIRIVGFIATVAVTVYVTKVAKKALNESVGDTSAPATHS